MYAEREQYVSISILNGETVKALRVEADGLSSRTYRLEEELKMYRQQLILANREIERMNEELEKYSGPMKKLQDYMPYLVEFVREQMERRRTRKIKRKVIEEFKQNIRK